MAVRPLLVGLESPGHSRSPQPSAPGRWNGEVQQPVGLWIGPAPASVAIPVWAPGTHVAVPPSEPADLPAAVVRLPRGGRWRQGVLPAAQMRAVLTPRGEHVRRRVDVAGEPLRGDRHRPDPAPRGDARKSCRREFAPTFGKETTSAPAAPAKAAAKQEFQTPSLLGCRCKHQLRPTRKDRGHRSADRRRAA